MDTQTTFWTEARQAIRRGLLSEQEARTIARSGTRKASYWQRHLQDLRAVVRDRSKGRG